MVDYVGTILMLERSKQIQENTMACYENPFIYGLIHTPVNRPEYYKADYDEYSYFFNEARAFAFIWDQMTEECENEYDDPFARPVLVRTFDLPGRNDFRTNKRSCLHETDFPYPANALADLFEYSEGEQFYHSLTVDDDLPANFGL